MWVRLASAGFVALLMCADGWAQAKPPEAPASGVKSSSTTSTTSDGKKEVTRTETVVVSDEDQNAFLRQFSVGVGSLNLKAPEVRKASVVGGVVRVEESSQYRNAFWLQTNWVLDKQPFGKDSYWPSVVRPGIWAGLEVGSDNKLLNGVAAGIQISFLKRQKTADGASATAVNLGYGWYRSSIQTLGDGIEEGKALPAGVESVTYRQRSVTGKMWMLSLNVAAF